MTWVRIETDPPSGFFDVAGEDAGLPDLAFRRLFELSPIRRGLGPGGESANATVQLENGDGALSEFFKVPPLRAAVSLGAGSETLLSGIVTQISGASLLTLTIEG